MGKAGQSGATGTGQVLAITGWKTGMVLQSLVSAGLFLWFRFMGLDWTKALIVLLVSIIMMALSLYAEFKASEVGVT